MEDLYAGGYGLWEDRNNWYQSRPIHHLSFLPPSTPPPPTSPPPSYQPPYPPPTTQPQPPTPPQNPYFPCPPPNTHQPPLYPPGPPPPVTQHHPPHLPYPTPLHDQSLNHQTQPYPPPNYSYPPPNFSVQPLFRPAHLLPPPHQPPPDPQVTPTSPSVNFMREVRLDIERRLDALITARSEAISSSPSTDAAATSLVSPPPPHPPPHQSQQETLLSSSTSLLPPARRNASCILEQKDRFPTVWGKSSMNSLQSSIHKLTDSSVETQEYLDEVFVENEVHHEVSIMVSKDEKHYEHGVHEYLFVPLWCSYFNYVQEHDPLVPQCAPVGIDKMKNLFEHALTAAGLHIVEDNTKWEAAMPTSQVFNVVLIGLQSGDVYSVSLRQRLRNLPQAIQPKPPWEQSKGGCMSNLIWKCKDFRGTPLEKSFIMSSGIEYEKDLQGLEDTPTGCERQCIYNKFNFEVVEACSRRFHFPFQFFYSDSVKLLPVEPVKPEELKPLSSGHDAQISVFGSKLQRKPEQATVFLIGTGVRSCEKFLQNFALMGVGCSHNRQLITEDDEFANIKHNPNLDIEEKPMPVQFMIGGLPQQTHHFILPPSQQFQPVQGMYLSIPKLGAPVLPLVSQISASSSVVSAPALSKIHSHPVTRPSSSETIAPSAPSNSSLGTTDATNMLNATPPMSPLPASSPANSVLVEDTIEIAAKKISSEIFSDENVTTYVIVYLEESMKPSDGQSLNKPANETLLNVKCTNKMTGQHYMEGLKLDKFKEMLIKNEELTSKLSLQAFAHNQLQRLHLFPSPQGTDINKVQLEGGKIVSAQLVATACKAEQGAEVCLFDELSSFLDVKQRPKAAHVICLLLREQLVHYLGNNGSVQQVSEIGKHLTATHELSFITIFDPGGTSKIMEFTLPLTKYMQ